MPGMTGPLRIGALISGGGRTLVNLADQIDAGTLDARIAVVISSRASAPGVVRARGHGLPVEVIARREGARGEAMDAASEEHMHEAIAGCLRKAGVDLVCACGYLHKIRLDPSLEGRVMNIHPALLPDFGGRGMYGERVHRAVLAAKRTISGCTVHFVDEEYDHGPIILQRRCPVEPGDDAASLAARVFEQECIAYPDAIRLFAAGRLRTVEGGVEIGPAGNTPRAGEV